MYQRGIAFAEVPCDAVQSARHKKIIASEPGDDLARRAAQPC